MAHVVERNDGQVQIGVAQKTSEFSLFDLCRHLCVEVLDHIVQFVVIHVDVEGLLADSLLKQVLLLVDGFPFLAVFKVRIFVVCLALSIQAQLFQMISQKLSYLKHVFGVVVVLKLLFFRLLQQVSNFYLPLVILVDKVEDFLSLVPADMLVNLIAVQVVAQFMQ